MAKRRSGRATSLPRNHGRYRLTALARAGQRERFRRVYQEAALAAVVAGLLRDCRRAAPDAVVPSA